MIFNNEYCVLNFRYGELALAENKAKELLTNGERKDVMILKNGKPLEYFLNINGKIHFRKA